MVAATFLVAWRRIDEAVGAEHPLAWLYGVAYRVLANQRRSARRKTRLSSRVAEATEGLEADIAPEAAESHETLKRVFAAMETLSAADREVLRLAAFEELSHAEIAQVIGVRPGLVRSRLYRARRRLQDAYEQLGEER